MFYAKPSSSFQEKKGTVRKSLELAVSNLMKWKVILVKTRK